MKEKKYLKIPLWFIKLLFVGLVIGAFGANILMIFDLNNDIDTLISDSEASINDAYNKGYVDTINNVLNNIARTGSVVINLPDNTSVELVPRGD